MLVFLLSTLLSGQCVVMIRRELARTHCFIQKLNQLRMMGAFSCKKTITPPARFVSFRPIGREYPFNKKEIIRETEFYKIILFLI